MLKKAGIFFISIILIISILSGCSIGFINKKNKDFEYMKQGKVTKININSTRDKGFRFVVTDERAIKDIYDILSSAKSVSKKSSLKPDYTFEICTEGNKTYKFNYIAGLKKNTRGNFYSDNKSYYVSKRIDNDVISGFSNMRMPRDFKNVYYNSILSALKKYRENINDKDLIGINIEDDVEVEQFILSSELYDFEKSLDRKGYNSNIINNDNYNYSIVMDVKTEGYKTDLVNSTGIYKCTITFQNKRYNSKKNYYIFDKYENNRWKIKVYADKKPQDF